MAAELVFAAAWRVRALALAGLCALATPSLAQVVTVPQPGRQPALPRINYYAAMEELNGGEYKDALKDFQASSRGAFKGVNGRWIDSICHYAMIGESYYRLGRPAEALEFYTKALHVYLAYPQWMLRVQFPQQLQASSRTDAVRPIPWGRSTRRARAAALPDVMLVAQGKINVIPLNGVVQPPMFRKIRVDEIARCTALALRRRRELMGPLCKYDPLNDKLLAAAGAGIAARNPLSMAWGHLIVGLIHASADQNAPAVVALRRATTAGGQFDHPLTSVALLELGRISLAQKQLDAAAGYLLEASYAAFRFPNPGVLEESLRLGHVVHTAAGKRGAYAPLQQAALWAKQKRRRELRASLLLSIAESELVSRKLRGARVALVEAGREIARREMIDGVIGARYRWQDATLAFAMNNTRAAEAALATSLKFMSGASTRLFQIALADGARAKVSPRVAMELYTRVLREPTAADWIADPMESTAVLTTPHVAAYEHWFETALTRKEPEKAMQIADRTRRHRFYTTLPLGGRLLSLRWLLEGPVAALDKAGVMQRQDLLGRYPVMAKASILSGQIQTALRAAPIAPKDIAAQKAQQTALTQLATAAGQQEFVLHEMALRREPAQLVFPPIHSMGELQKRLPKGHAAWIFFQTSRNLYAFMIGSQTYDYWRIAQPEKIKDEIALLLRGLGNYDQKHQLGIAQLKSDIWKASARKLTKMLVAGSQVDLSRLGEELVVVPDGPLWYLPFELLQVGEGDNSESLFARARLRYAPTASLTVPFQASRAIGGTIGVRVGRVHARDDLETTVAAFERTKRSLSSAVRLQDKLAAPSPLYGKLLDGLIVLDEIDAAPTGPYAWSPAQVERSRTAGALSQWFQFPRSGPRYMILPGYATAAETSMKRKGAAPSGNEVFLSLCGLMSTGSETILLSRWRTGGKTCLDLTHEFVMELPNTTATDAWQRSVQLARQSQLDPQREPRVKRLGIDEEPPTADHPLFWSGYMLVDSGWSAEAEKLAKPPEKPPAKQAAKDAQ